MDIKKIAYDKTDDMEAKIIAEQAALGRVLVEVQNHVDGDYLVFTDTPPPPPPPTIEEEIAEIKARLAAIEKNINQTIETYTGESTA